MKKNYRLLMLAFFACTLQMYAETVKLGGLYYSLGSNTATVVSDQSSDKSVYSAYTSVTIPASVTYNAYTYPVTSIGTSAFKNCSNLQSVTLPVSVTSIGTSAFESCSNLQSVVLPASVTTIGTDAFWGCSKLGSVNLEEGLTTISTRAFYNCNLTSVTIPSTVTSIGNGAFKENPTTTIVWKPITCSIGSDSDAPFYSEYSQITSFTFGDKVEVVPAYLCKRMSKIEKIVLPPSVKALGQAAFMYCTSLKSINLPVTQKTLPVSFLEGCTSLESIELPATLTTILHDAFYGCTKLSNVNINEGLTTIEQRAFYNCNLTSVTIPSTVTSIGNGAFKSNPLTAVTWLPADCSIGSDDSAPFYSEYSNITSFTFGDKVEVVPAYLCKRMSKIEKIVLPPSVKALGQAAFMYCTSLKSINLPVTQKTLPVSFLEGCTSLESIELPATLTTILRDAFYGCSKLSNVNIDEGLTTIEARAFWGCNLTSVTIPSTLTSLGNAAFKSNPLTSVTWLPANCSIGTDESAPFYSTSSQVTSFTFGNQVETIPAYLCKHMSKIEKINLPPSVKSIGQSAFMYCTALKSFAFPQGITTVATSILEGCTALESLVIPSSVTTINQDAFYNCSSLKEIYNYAKTPQTITERVVNNVNKSTCTLYVPTASLELYSSKLVWCDFLNRIGMEPIHYEFSETACDSFTWDGTTYTDSGDKVKEYVAVNGLDSIVVLHLTVNRSTSSVETRSEIESYTWNGVTYNESGDYEFVTTNAAGCDSIATLHLTIIPVWKVTLVQPEHGTIVVQEDIELDKVPDGDVLHFSAIPDDGYEFEAWQGCQEDGSLVVKENISVSCTFAPQPIYTNFNETACDSYTWEGTTYTTSDDIVKTFVAVNGADSIVTLHLTVNHSTSSVETRSEVESYTWNGETYTESGDYEFVTTNAAGCDSLATLHLTIVPVWKVTVEQPEHGTVAVKETGVNLDKVEDLTVLHFTATPDDGWLFDSWQGCNADGSLTVTEDVTVTCSFVKDTTGFDNLGSDASFSQARKTIRDGQLLIILPDGRTYNVLGSETNQ